MRIAANHSFPATPTDFTIAETGSLMAWGQANGLEVVMQPAEVDGADKLACVGYGHDLASWTLHRDNGRLWLARIGDRAGQPCEGWLGAVGSIDEAMGRIMMDDSL